MLPNQNTSQLKRQPHQAGFGVAGATSKRRWFWLGIGFLVLGVMAMQAAWLMKDDLWIIHGIWCGLGIALAVPTLFAALRHGFEIILTDHLVMFLGAFLLYFLVGAILLAVGPEAQIRHSLAYYPIDARDAMRVNSVNGIGFGLALMAACLSHGRWLGRQADRLSAATSRVTTSVAVTFFLVVGASASLYVMSVDLGLRDGIAAGIWRLVSQFSLVAIFLGSAHRGRGEKGLLAAVVIVALLEAIGGLLLFNKTATLLPLAALVAGLSMRYRRRFVLPLGAAFLAFVFLSIGGLVGFGRNTLVGNSASVLPERLQLLREGFLLAHDGSVLTAYAPWSRLSYTVPQAAALDFYDVGKGGDEIRLIPWLIVPRALAPEKPIITQASADFHTKITGQTGSSTGQGIFVSAYYNAGWIGVVFLSVLCGWILAQTSAIARVVVRRRAILFYPLALLGVFMAFRIDGHFLADYLGPFVFILYLLAVPAILLGVLRRSSSPPSLHRIP